MSDRFDCVWTGPQVGQRLLTAMGRHAKRAIASVLRHLQTPPQDVPAPPPKPTAAAAAAASSHEDPRQGGRHRDSTVWPGAWGDYALDGYTVLPQVLDEETMRHCRDHVEYLTHKFPSIPTEHLHHVIYRDDPFWIRLVSDQRLLECAAAHAPDFLGDGPITLFSSNYFCKMPHSEASVLWHQDGS